jgi:hypothetical protein
VGWTEPQLSRVICSKFVLQFKCPIYGSCVDAVV